MAAVANDNFFGENWKYLLAAALLHVAIAVLFTYAMNNTRQAVIPGQLAIKAVVIDHTAQRLKREKDKAEAERLAREQAEAEQKSREQAEAEQQRREEQVKREEELRQKNAAEQKRKAEEQHRMDEERQAVARKRTDAEKQRVAEIKAKQDAKQKNERDTREQVQREAELKRQLAEEEGIMQVQNSGLMNQYAALIEQRVVRNWNKPSSARQGIECDVKVAQAPGGTVLSVQIDKCNGDQAVRQSIEAAVYRSSPLPPPPDARLFQRVIVFVFKPAE
jgi:colicin import membrane protein